MGRLGMILTAILLPLVVLWDGMTTILGSIQIATEGIRGNMLAQTPGEDPSFAAAALRGGVFGAALYVIVFYMFSRTDEIWNASGASGMVFRICWFIALIFDAYTSYWGNRSYIFPGVSGMGQIVFNFAATALTIGAVITMSTKLLEKSTSSGPP